MPRGGAGRGPLLIALRDRYNDAPEGGLRWNGSIDVACPSMLGLTRSENAPMKAVFSFVALLGLVVTAHAQEIELFNGKDLSGWVPVLSQADADPAMTWSVADGILRCTGKPSGYIRTDRDDFENYKLTLQYRWPEGTEGGNNGVLVHTSDAGALGIWPRSIEVQLMKGNAGDFWVIGTDLDVPNEESRKNDRRHVNLTDDSEKPIGEWNTLEIICRGDQIRVSVNGDVVNEASNCTATKGAICLQSEGAQIEFRDVKLQPLGQ